MLATLLQIAGLTIASIGIGLIFIPAGIITAGLSIVLIGLALERGR